MGDKQGKSRPDQKPNPAKKPTVEAVASPEQLLVFEELAPFASIRDLPRHSTTRPLRQANILQLQRLYGNGYVQRLLAQRQDEKGAGPTETEKAAAQAAAASAKRKHPVLKTVQVVDGGDCWDYDYVFRTSLVSQIKKLFGKDSKSKVQKERCS